MLLTQSTPLLIATLLVLLAPFVLCIAVFAMFFSTWMRGYISGVPVMIVDLVRMRLRQTDVKAVMNALVTAKQGGVTVACVEMEKAWIQGVDLEKVTLAMIQSHKQNMGFTFEQLVDAELEDRLAEKLAGSDEAPREEPAYS